MLFGRVRRRQTANEFRNHGTHGAKLGRISPAKVEEGQGACPAPLLPPSGRIWNSLVAQSKGDRETTGPSLTQGQLIHILALVLDQLQGGRSLVWNSISLALK